MAGFDYDRARQSAARHTAPTWPEERVIALIDLHEAGIGFGQMAWRLTTPDIPCTKNACIGKAHRLGLPPRGNMIGKLNERSMARARARRKATFAAKLEAQGRAYGPDGKPRRQSRAKGALPGQWSQPGTPRGRAAGPAVVRSALALDALSPGRISNLAATQCKWPVGDPKDPDFGFCGRLKREDGPYCPAHHAAAFKGRPKAPVQTEDRPRARAFATPRFGAWA